MEKIRAYKDHENKYYALKEDILSCDKCGKDLDYLAFLILDYTYNKKKLARSFFYYCCPDCSNKVSQIGEELQKIILILVDEIPPGAVPSFFGSVGLKESSSISVFDVADLDKLGGITLDNTKYSNRVDLAKELLAYREQERAKELEDLSDFKSGLELLEELKPKKKGIKELFND